MQANEIIIYVMLFSMVLGALDSLFGNKYGIGEKFEEGIMTMGSLALAMIGILSLVPVLSKGLQPIVTPIFQFLGADPAMFAGSILATDMGGYKFAMGLAQNKEAGLLAGSLLSAMLGTTFSFTLPIALKIVGKEDRELLGKGILAGVLTIPVGCLVGGMVAGFSVGNILKNIFPIIVVCFLLAFALLKKPGKVMKGFEGVGKGVVILSICGFILITVETLTGISILKGMAPFKESIEIVGKISLLLSGAYPLVYLITKIFHKSFVKIGSRFGLGEMAVVGILASLVNNIPTFYMMKEMKERGKMMSAAFSVSGAFVFGGQLGFVAGINKEMLLPFIIGKLSAALSAVGLCYLLFVYKLPSASLLQGGYASTSSE